MNRQIMKTFKDAEDFIYSFVDYEKKMPARLDVADTFNLNSFKAFLEAIGNPHTKLKCVHIAGTRGKGSTAGYISSLLVQAGYNVGLFTSPHIKSIKERFKINGKDISDEDFLHTVIFLKKAVEKNKYNCDGNYRTAFELMTALAFIYFLDKKVDIAVFETGLGGRLDSTNVISPLLSVITSLGYDHTHLLGNTIESITFEKAGIIKPSTPIVLGKQFHNEEIIVDKVKNIADEKNAPFYNFPHIIEICKRAFKPNYQIFSGKIFANAFEYEISMNGIHQIYNALTAVIAAKLLNKKGFIVDEPAIKKGLKGHKLPGRIEIMPNNNVSIVVDGAHCPLSAEYLNYTLNELFPDIQRIILLNILSDKDGDGIIRNLTNNRINDTIITFDGTNPRSMSGEMLKNTALKYCKNVVNAGSLENAIELAFSLINEKKRLILITGSFYNIQLSKVLLKANYDGNGS